MTTTTRHITLGQCTVDLLTRVVHRGGQETRLTLQEARLLGRLAQTPDEAVSRQTLLEDVWEYHPDSRSRAPDVAIRRLRTKIEEDPSNPAHLCTVLGQGWVLRGLADEAQPRQAPDPDVIGRDALIAQVNTALRQGAVLLVGPPGVGKTVVAQQAFRGLPVATVSLEGATSEADLFAAVAAALRIPLTHVTAPGEHLGDVLARRDPILWLDAPEAVSAPVAHWAGCWPCRVLISSRVPITPEDRTITTISVPPLSTEASMALFQRVTGQGFTPDPARIRAFVAHLDGLPLTVRLAAARARVVGLDALIGEEGVRHDRIGSGPLEDAVARSWSLLDDTQRAVLIALSSFVGAFSLEAAEAVAPGNGWVGDHLVDLVDHSLVDVEGSPPQYRLLQSVRWYALRQGTADLAPLMDWVRDHETDWRTVRHAIHRVRESSPELAPALVVAVDERVGDGLAPADRESLLRSVQQTAAVRRALLKIAWRRGDPDVIDDMESLIDELGEGPLADALRVDLAGARRSRTKGSAEGLTELRGILDRARTPALRISTLLELAEQHTDRREFVEARVALQQALAIDERNGGAHRVALLCNAGHVALNQGLPERGLDAVVEATELIDHGTLAERAWRTLGGLRWLAGDLDEAATAWEHAQGLARDLGIWRQYVVSLGNLGIVYAELGDLREARRVVEEALARSRELHQVQSWLPSLVNLGKITLLDGLPSQARPLLEEAAQLAQDNGWGHLDVHAQLGLAIADQLEGRPAAERLVATIAAAEQLTMPGEASAAAAHLAEEDPLLGGIHLARVGPPSWLHQLDEPATEDERGDPALLRMVRER